MAADNAGSRRTATATALAVALEPLVDLLLQLGVTAVEAEDVLRSVFVRVARDQIERESPRASLSRVALKCGLYRSDVSRRLSQLAGAESSAMQPDQHRLNRLLAAWYSDPDFLDASGRPRDLALQGSRSFEVLVSRYAANLYPAVVLEELRRVGALTLIAEKRVRVLSREYIAQDLDQALIQEMGATANDVLTSLVHRVRAPRTAPTSMSAMGFHVAPEFLPLIRRVIRTRSAAFVRLMDEELNDSTRESKEGGVRVGLYVIGVESEISQPLSAGTQSGRSKKRRAPRGP